MPALAPLLAGLCLAAPQEPAPPATAPEPVLRIVVAGPALWRQAFLPTSIGGLLAAREGDELVTPWLAALRARLGALGEDAAWQGWRGYRGVVEVELFGDAAPAGKRRTAWTGVLRCSDDGSTDLDALASAAATALEGHRRRPVEVHGHALELVQVAGDTLTLPFRHHGALLAAFGDDLERTLPAVLDRPRPAEPATLRQLARQLARQPLRVELDLQRALALGLGDDRDDRAIATLLGASSLRSLELALRPAGPHAMLELGMTFGDAPRGLFATLFPDRQALPKLGHLIPPDVAGWKAGHLDLEPVLDAVVDVLAEHLHDGDRAAAQQEVANMLGYDPIADLDAHLSDEVLVLSAPFDPDREGYYDSPLDDGCLVFGVRDDAAFGRAWQQKQHLLPMFFREPGTWQHAGIDVQSGSSLFGDSRLHTCHAEGLWIVAFGDGGEELLRAVLDRRKPPAKPTPLPGLTDARRRFAPPGLNGAADADIRAVVAGPLKALAEMLDEFLPPEVDLDLWDGDLGDGDLGDDISSLAPAWPFLVEHHLDRAMTMTGYQDGRWCFRVLW